MSGWYKLARAAPFSRVLLWQLAPYLTDNQLTNAADLVHRLQSFYVIAPPLSLSNCLHWLRVHAGTDPVRISHAYVTPNADRAPALNIPVLGYANEATDWALDHWRDSLHAPPTTPACVHGYLLYPPNSFNEQKLQLAYAGLLAEGAVVELLGSDDEPLCELLDDRLTLAACWAPLVGEYSALVRPALQLLHCSICGGGITRARCNCCGCVYGDMAMAAATMVTGNISCCIPRQCAMLLTSGNYHRFGQDPADARKREHLSWASSVGPAPPLETIDNRPKRSIKLCERTG